MLKTLILSLLAGLQLFTGSIAFVPAQDVNVADSSVSLQQAGLPTEYESRPVAAVRKNVKIPKVTDSQVDYVKKLTDMGVKMHPGKEFAEDSVDNPKALNHCASLVYKTLQMVPSEAAGKVKDLTLYFNSTGRRGLGGGSTIILRCQNVSDNELVGVLVHELGHVEDTGVLLGNSWTGASSEFKDGQNTINNDDPSLEFYKISFANDSKIMPDATDMDFVSGYAKSDPFEDFAETFNYYLLHGDDFRQIANGNDALQRKYDFMKNEVFAGKEFNFNSESDPELLTTRHYDATLIAYNLNKFLAI